ncbi:MAG: bifunctional UDP-N-acetylglucosamine diphosphorylase/glucosamine-1-phosphate N-acetyltransferase GlmU [Solirubrobacterales bacterium]
MAAGEGTRMHSSLPKVLHPVCGRPMVAWPILAAAEAGADRIAVIVSPKLEQQDIAAALPQGAEAVVQPRPDGTGGAVRAALGAVREAGTVVVLNGDHPLVTAELIERVVGVHRDGGAAATVVTVERDDAESLGRIVRDDGGEFERIVETKHLQGVPEDVLAITEVNTNTFVFEGAALADALERISDDNAAGEYYIGDTLTVLREQGKRVLAHRESDVSVNVGVNNRAELAAVNTEARRRILEAHMIAGVTVTDPGATWVDADVELAADATIEPGTSLRGRTVVGAGSVVGPITTLIDCELGERVHVPHSYLVECEVLDGCSVGPFAYIRPQTVLAEGAKAGSFVEIKNSRIGEGAKVPHLSYVGDTEIGRGTNVGAGSITANYDGFRKHRTVIGEHCRIAVDTMFVAPVSIGDGAYTGAGTVVRKDVPPGALAVPHESRQRHIEGYAERKAKQAEQDEKKS